MSLLSSSITTGMLSGMAESTDQSDKVRENRLRRMAERQGLRLEKSRRRDPRALDYGTYALVQGSRDGNWRSRELVAGDHNTGYGMTLDEVEQQLSEGSLSSQGDQSVTTDP